MDTGEFATKLLEKCLETIPHKYNTFRNIILNLSDLTIVMALEAILKTWKLYYSMFLILVKAVLVYFHSFTYISCVNYFLEKFPSA